MNSVLAIFVMRHFFRYCKLIFAFLLIGLGSLSPVFADGSKDLYPTNNGGRAYMMSSTGRIQATMEAWPFPMLGEHFVYAKVGEYIAVGSSVMGHGNGGIRLTAPNGTVYTHTGSSTGRITNRTAELAGPRLPGGGGDTYIPYERQVVAGQEGVWKVEFLPAGPSNSTTQTENPGRSFANVWTQATDNGADNLNIAAWDVSVRNNAGNASQWIPGRVYVNLLHLYLPQDGTNFTSGYGFGATMYTLTKDGYVYRVNNNGNYGVGFAYFANNNGFINKVTNEPLYTSVNTSSNIIDYVHSPIAADAGGNITNKMFYRLPASDLPVTSVSQAVPGGSTWLRVPRIPPEVYEVKVIGYDGTVGQISNKGGYFYFETDNLASRYTILIMPPVAQPGLFVTRILTGPAEEGENWIPWDGKDGAGNDLPPGIYSPQLGVSLQTAEVHFPYIDMEINPNGIIIELMKDDLTGVEPGMDKVFWNDTGVDNTTSGPNRPSPVNASHTAIPAGTSSNSNGHRWGAYGASSGTSGSNNGNGDNGFGNNKSIDTWTFVEGETQSFTPEIFVTEADVETMSITSDQVGVVSVGDSWNYTVQVRNIGTMDILTNTDPNAGLLTGPASFMLYVPDGIDLDPLQVGFSSGCGVAIVGTPTFANGVYTAKLDMPVGCVATFTIPVTAVSGIQTGNGYVNTWATMLRPDDFTDPDATNPFPDIQPQDPFFEADGIQTAVDGPGGLGDDLFLLPSSINTSQTNNIKLNNQPYMLADLRVVKTVNPASGHSPLNPVVFTIVATNNGPSNATNVHVQDLFTDRYTYVSHTVSTGSYNHTTGDWNINTLANGASATMTITATINHSANPQINIATVTADEFDPDDSNNEDDAVTDAEFNADLEIVKVGTRTAEDGGNATFTLTVRNNGPGVALGVVVTDNLTDRYNFTNPASNHTASHGTLAWAGTQNRNLTWTVGNLAVNEVATLVFTTTNNATGDRVNTATVTAVGPDPNPNNNTYTLDFPTNTGAPVDLGVTKTVDKPTPVVGEEVTFTITLTRVAGTDQVHQVVVTDALPSGFIYSSHTASQGTYNKNTGEWSVGTIGNNTPRTLVIKAFVKSPLGAPNEFLNVVSITGASRSDNNLSNNVAQAGVSPQIVDLSINKTIDDTTPDEGQPITFTVTVTNHGPATATGVTVFDKLPNGYTYTGKATSTGTYNEVTGVWTIGSLNSAGTATLTINAIVNAAGQYVNSAEVSGTLQETTYTNNSSRVVVNPTCEIRNVSPKLNAVP